MDKHRQDLKLLEKRKNRAQTSLAFVIFTWASTFALGSIAYYTLNSSKIIALIIGFNFIILIINSTVVSLRHFHLEPLAREIIFLNNEIVRIKNNKSANDSAEQ